VLQVPGEGRQIRPDDCDAGGSDAVHLNTVDPPANPIELRSARVGHHGDAECADVPKRKLLAPGVTASSVVCASSPFSVGTHPSALATRFLGDRVPRAAEQQAARLGASLLSWKPCPEYGPMVASRGGLVVVSRFRAQRFCVSLIAGHESLLSPTTVMGRLNTST